MANKHSSFWLDKTLQDQIFDRYQHINDPKAAKKDIEYILQLSGIRRAVSNFVRIVTGQDIPVRFSTGKMSYAVASAKKKQIVIAADIEPDHFDSMVGVALHEGSHIVYSNGEGPRSLPVFDFIQHLTQNPTHFTTPSIEKNATRLNIPTPIVAQQIGLVVNWLEDRRIDEMMYKDAVGYRGYYQAMYNRYWFTPENEADLASPFLRIPTVKNYMFVLLNLFHPNIDLALLPKLDEINRLVDLSNIRRFTSDKKWHTWMAWAGADGQGNVKYALPTLPEMVARAIEIVDIIYENSIMFELPNSQDDADDLEECDPDNLDYAAMGRFDESITRRIVTYEAATKAGFGEAEVNEHSLSNEEQDSLTALEGATAKVMDVGDGRSVPKCRSIVYQRFTPDLLNVPSFPFVYRSGNNTRERPGNMAAILRGRRKGHMLAHQIRVLGDDKPLIYPNQRSGKINKRQIAGLGYGLENVFCHSFIERHEPVAIHLSIDSSGSMEGEKWEKAIELASALAVVAEKVPLVELVISFRCGDRIVEVLVAYDSRVDKFVKILSMFKFLTASGGTPEGLAFESISSVIHRDTKAKRKFFINISDGEPSFHSSSGGNSGKTYYGGDVAYRHTAQEVRKMEQDGIIVLSYFVEENRREDLRFGHGFGTLGGNKDAFRQMYGKTAEFIDPSSIPEIARTLNKRLLTG